MWLKLLTGIGIFGLVIEFLEETSSIREYSTVIPLLDGRGFGAGIAEIGNFSDAYFSLALKVTASTCD